MFLTALYSSPTPTPCCCCCCAPGRVGGQAILKQGEDSEKGRGVFTTSVCSVMFRGKEEPPMGRSCSLYHIIAQCGRARRTERTLQSQMPSSLGMVMLWMAVGRARNIEHGWQPNPNLLSLVHTHRHRQAGREAIVGYDARRKAASFNDALRDI